MSEKTPTSGKKPSAKVDSTKPKTSAASAPKVKKINEYLENANLVWKTIDPIIVDDNKLVGTILEIKVNKKVSNDVIAKLGTIKFVTKVSYKSNVVSLELGQEAEKFYTEFAKEQWDTSSASLKDVPKFEMPKINYVYKPSNKFEEIAWNVYKVVGPYENIVSITNCMTRLRLSVAKPVSDSMLKALKDIDGVLNAVTAGAHNLQVIIGPNVAKVAAPFKIIKEAHFKDDESNGIAKVLTLSEIAAIEKDNQKQKNQSPIQVFLGKFSQIFAPLIIVFIGAGLLAGIAGFIQLSVDNESWSLHPTSATYYEFCMLSLNVLMNVFIIIVGWRAAEAFGGSGAFGAVAAAIFAPALGNEAAQAYQISAPSADPYVSFLGLWDIHFDIETENISVADNTVSSTGYHWMASGFRPTITAMDNPTETIWLVDAGADGSLGTADDIKTLNPEWSETYKVALAYPSGNVFGALIIGITSAFLEKGVRKNMPGSIDLVLSSIIILFVLEVANFFVVIPLAGLLFSFVAWLFVTLLMIPLGLGAAVLGGVFLLAVVFGIHQGFVPVYAALLVSPALGGMGVNALFPILAMGGAGQVGAAIALLARSKKGSAIRGQITGAIIPGFLGIGEPLIYGVTLPRMKPFITACFGGAMGAWFIGLVNWFQTGAHWNPNDITDFSNVIGLATPFGPSGLLATPFMTTGMNELGETTSRIWYAMGIYLIGLFVGYGSGFGFTYVWGYKGVDLA